MDYLVKAINKLKPSAQFSFVNNDYSTIEWIVLDGDAPTQLEIDAAIEKIKNDEALAESDKATKKAEAEAKFLSLGLNADDLKALGLD